MVARVVDIVLEADVVANRPAAASVPVGALFPATDDAVVYRNNGSSWDTWATLGGTPAAEDVAFTPAGTIAATDVQAAIEEVASEAGGAAAFIGARAYRSAALSLSSGSVTTIGLDAESYDSATLHDNSTNNSRITVPSAGKYLCTAQLSIAGGNQGVQIRLLVNGSLKTIKVNANNSSLGVDTNITDVLSLAANDYVEMAGFQNSGGSLALNVGEGSCYLAVAFLGS